MPYPKPKYNSESPWQEGDLVCFCEDMANPDLAKYHCLLLEFREIKWSSGGWEYVFNGLLVSVTENGETRPINKHSTFWVSKHGNFTLLSRSEKS